MCCPFWTVDLTEKTISLKGKFRLVVTKEGAVKLEHEDEVFLPVPPDPVAWRYVFDNEGFRDDYLARQGRSTFATYFVGARIVSVIQSSVELSVAVREIDGLAYASHTVRFVRKATTIG